jgi:hypothetical protein
MHQISISGDAHKRYSQVEVQDLNGQILSPLRIDHTPGAIRTVLDRFPRGTPPALESLGKLARVDVEGPEDVVHQLREEKMIGNALPGLP